jgi:coniferyl-aldehyde dehydrogenase
MSIIDRPATEQGADDGAAITELHEAFERQQAAFRRDPYPSLEARRERLQALAGMVVGHREQIRQALREDFGSHPDLFSDIIEMLGIAGRAAYTIEQLERWMAPERRDADPALYGSGQAFLHPQPKGVVGNIVPWNFPFDIGLGPLCEILGAGNRVIIKPSDYTPACAEVMRDMVRATFDRDLVDVAVGGIGLAREFSTLRWDHLLYTGSPAVGREVYKAAAEQLVPVTLELGGKCPAIFTADAVDARSIEQVIGVKAIKNGQMCISVDYCLVPRERMDDFVRLAREHVAAQMPDYSATEDCTGIISDRHFERLERLREEAAAAGCEVVQLDEGGAPDPATRRMPISLVVDPPAELGVMREEVFGPLLPVKAYDSLDEALDHVNGGERPLGLYAFTYDDEAGRRLRDETVSGGFCRNTAAIQGALPSLGFGGVGTSGMGRHHGIEGFREFSNLRGVFVRGEDEDMIGALTPPYGELAAALVAAALGEGDSKGVGEPEGPVGLP